MQIKKGTTVIVEFNGERKELTAPFTQNGTPNSPVVLSDGLTYIVQSATETEVRAALPLFSRAGAGR